jgi:DNA-binding CsgD family transcriptional regulator
VLRNNLLLGFSRRKLVEIIGREQELERISRFLEAVPGGPAALLLEGEAGIGKTTLWEAGVAGGGDRGYRILACRASGSETQLPFAGLGDLLAEVPPDVFSSLPPPQRRAVDVALLKVEAEGPLPDWRAVSLATLNIVRALAQSGPLIIAIDDAQWLDSPTSRVLESSFRRLGRAPIGVLASVRGSVDRPAVLDLVRAMPTGQLDRCPISQLAIDDLRRVISGRLGQTFPRHTLRELHRMSGGNPFFALEIARALQRRGAHVSLGEGLPIPAHLQDLVRERLANLPKAARDVLPVISAAALPTIALLEACVGPRHRIDAGLARASEAGVIELKGHQIRFTHPLLASGVYSGIPLDRKRRIHARLAEVINDLEERARHLALCTDAPNDDVATALDEAAEKAHARGAPETAAELLVAAERFTTGAGRTGPGQRTIEAANLYVATADYAEARALMEDVLATLQGHARAAALVALGDARLRDSIPGAVRIYEEALVEAGPDHHLQASIHYALAVARGGVGGDFPQGLAHARAALEHAEQARDPALLSLALGCAAWFEMAVGLGVDQGLVDRNRAVERSHPIWNGEIPSEDLGFIMLWADDLEGARERQQYLYEGFVERGMVKAASNALMSLSEIEYRAGNFEAAADYAERGLEMVPEGDTYFTSAMLFRKAQADAHLGRIDEARGEAERGVAMGEPWGTVRFVFTHLGVLGFLHLSLGDAANAHGHLRTAVELARGCGLAEPGLLRFVPDEIEALVTLGKLDDAKLLLEWWEERSRTLDRAYGLASAARCRGLLLAALGDLPGAIASSGEAFRYHERILDQPFERARTLLVMGEIHRRARHKRAAKEALREAQEIFDRLRAVLWADRARRELGRIGGRAPAPFALTPTEQEVAQLVAAGRTNREVASALFMSVKTVEGTLNRIYGKLLVRSRSELTARLVSGAPAAIEATSPPLSTP